MCEFWSGPDEIFKIQITLCDSEWSKIAIRLLIKIQFCRRFLRSVNRVESTLYWLLESI